MSAKRRKQAQKHPYPVETFLAHLGLKRGNGPKWVGGLLLGAVYIYLFYAQVIAPFTGRWRGIYGDPHCPEGYSIRGIDVSHYQGKIDWKEVAGAQIGSEPISFVFIKATEGTGLVDRNFHYNFDEAANAGLIRGAYHYFLPDSSAESQARHFIRNVRLENGDLPPVLDIETRGSLTDDELRKRARRWLDIVERHYGVKPILYTYNKFRCEYLGTSEFEAYPYWIAHYYVDTLAYDGAWKFWQHTDGGRVRGIRGKVDLNAYNGSMYDLRRLTLSEQDEEDAP